MKQVIVCAMLMSSSIFMASDYQPEHVSTSPTSSDQAKRSQNLAFQKKTIEKGKKDLCCNNECLLIFGTWCVLWLTTDQLFERYYGQCCDYKKNPTAHTTNQLPKKKMH